MVIGDEWVKLTGGWTVTDDGDSISERGKNHIVRKRQEYGGVFEDENVQVLELKRNGHQFRSCRTVGLWS